MYATEKYVRNEVRELRALNNEVAKDLGGEIIDLHNAVSNLQDKIIELQAVVLQLQEKINES